MGICQGQEVVLGVLLPGGQDGHGEAGPVLGEGGCGRLIGPEDLGGRAHPIGSCRPDVRRRDSSASLPAGGLGGTVEVQGGIGGGFLEADRAADRHGKSVVGRILPSLPCGYAHHMVLSTSLAGGGLPVCPFADAQGDALGVLGGDGDPAGGTRGEEGHRHGRQEGQENTPAASCGARGFA